MAPDIYVTITNQIAEAIKTGTKTYDMPWHRDLIANGRPVNALTKRQYTGVNILSLWGVATEKGYDTNEWATYNQWVELGAQVQRKEKGTISVFYKRYQREETNPDTNEPQRRETYVARASWLFNAAQVAGYAVQRPQRRNLVTIRDRAQTFVAAQHADIRHGGQRAFYRPSSDHIQMPDQDRFRDTETGSATEHYYSVLFHELTHWSGHPSRLDRNLSGRFGDQSYALEELVAELGAAFLCADHQVSNRPREDHASYVDNWLTVLARDHKAIFTASSKASQAAEFLNDRARSECGEESD